MPIKIPNSKIYTVFVITLTSLLLNLPVMAQDPYIGEIRMFGLTYCPRNWLETDGRVLSIAQFTSLYALYGNSFGGDGVRTFALPDLRGRVPLGRGEAPGLSHYRLGEKGGNENVSLSLQQMPEHNHGVESSKGSGENQTAVSTGGKEDSEKLSQPIQSAGSNLPHENRPPYLVMRYCVAVEGTFPQRE